MQYRIGLNACSVESAISAQTAQPDQDRCIWIDAVGLRTVGPGVQEPSMSETIQSAGHPVSLPRFIAATLHATDPRSGTEMTAQLHTLAGAATELEQDVDRWLAEIRPLAATDAVRHGGRLACVQLR
jgi:hypothetical protein